MDTINLCNRGKLTIEKCTMILINTITKLVEPFIVDEIKEVIDRVTENNTLSFSNNVILDIDHISDYKGYNVINFFDPFINDYQTIDVELMEYINIIKSAKRYNTLYDLVMTYNDMWNNVYKLIQIHNSIDDIDHIETFNNDQPFGLCLDSQLQEIQTSIELCIGEMGSIIKDWETDDISEYDFLGYSVQGCYELFIESKGDKE